MALLQFEKKCLLVLFTKKGQWGGKGCLQAVLKAEVFSQEGGSMLDCAKPEGQSSRSRVVNGN